MLPGFWQRVLKLVLCKDDETNIQTKPKTSVRPRSSKWRSQDLNRWSGLSLHSVSRSTCLTHTSYTTCCSNSTFFFLSIEQSVSDTICFASLFSPMLTAVSWYNRKGYMRIWLPFWLHFVFVTLPSSVPDTCSVSVAPLSSFVNLLLILVESE